MIVHFERGIKIISFELTSTHLHYLFTFPFHVFLFFEKQLLFNHTAFGMWQGDVCTHTFK